MKPFNLEKAKAKAGKPVQTVDGCAARIICFDAQTQDGYPIIALVKEGKTGEENCRSFTIRGENFCCTSKDLVMAPEEKVFYVNIYPEEDGCIHHSRKTADRAASHGNRIACVKVTYTEGQYDD